MAVDWQNVQFLFFLKQWIVATVLKSVLQNVLFFQSLEQDTAFTMVLSTFYPRFKQNVLIECQHGEIFTFAVLHLHVL